MANPPPDGGLHLLEWIGGLLAAGATLLGLKKASDERLDERAGAVARKILDDPQGPLARIEARLAHRDQKTDERMDVLDEKIDRVVADVAHLKGMADANSVRDSSFPERRRVPRPQK